VLFLFFRNLIFLRSSSIITSLFEYQTNNPDTGVALFYCNGNSWDKNRCSYIVSSILRQLITPLLRQDSPQMKHLQNLYRDSHKDPTVSELASSIRWLSKFFKRIYIVLDGLDECPQPIDVCAVLSELAVMNIKVLVLSQPGGDIAVSMKDKQKLEIEKRFVEADIAVYIDWRLQHDHNLGRMKPQLKREVKEKLLVKSSGMYVKRLKAFYCC
jgi:hypothetical protein